MCRSIKQLRRPERDVSEAEIAAAARQFVRKVSGYRVPGRANTPAFEAAVAEVAESTRRLLAAIQALPLDQSEPAQRDAAGCTLDEAWPEQHSPSRPQAAGEQQEQPQAA